MGGRVFFNPCLEYSEILKRGRVERSWVDTRASTVTQKQVPFVELYQPHNAVVNLLRPAIASGVHKHPSDWYIKA